MRTNIEIDDDLMRNAMAASGSATKKDAVEAGLRLLVQIQGQTRIRELRGKIVWRGPDDDWSASDKEILDKRQKANPVQHPGCVEAELVSTVKTRSL
jgi:Arc/MetJ family transcription regulator